MRSITTETKDSPPASVWKAEEEKLRWRRNFFFILVVLIVLLIIKIRREGFVIRRIIDESKQSSIHLITNRTAKIGGNASTLTLAHTRSPAPTARDAGEGTANELTEKENNTTRTRPGVLPISTPAPVPSVRDAGQEAANELTEKENNTTRTHPGILPMLHEAEANYARLNQSVPSYYYWNHQLNRLELPPHYQDKRRRPLSLEILQDILNSSESDASSEILDTDTCFTANTKATEYLADQVEKNELILSKPVLNVGMPKCGSTTLFSFFDCNKWKTSHDRNGQKYENRVRKGSKTPLRSSQRRESQAYMQLDYNHGLCDFPQISFLDELHMEYPNATFVLMFRPVMDWAESARQWFDLTNRWFHSSIPGLQCRQNSPYGDWSREHSECHPQILRSWWCNHVRHIREYVKHNPSHKLIELDLYNGTQTSNVLARLFGTNSSCWGHANANKQKGNGT